MILRVIIVWERSMLWKIWLHWAMTKHRFKRHLLLRAFALCCLHCSFCCCLLSLWGLLRSVIRLFFIKTDSSRWSIFSAGIKMSSRAGLLWTIRLPSIWEAAISQSSLTTCHLRSASWSFSSISLRFHYSWMSCTFWRLYLLHFLQASIFAEDLSQTRFPDVRSQLSLQHPTL